MIERFSGADALMWHMQRTDTPMHTLKVLILDPSRHGRPVTRDEVRHALARWLDCVPRATQRVIAVRGFGGRPFWVDDPAFDPDDHIDERTLEAPGDRRQLDDLYAELAVAQLDPRRPQWAMTLVHGLEGGRQAIVVRVHHALTDGLGAINAFLAVTADEPDAAVAPSTARQPAPIDRRDLRARAVRGVAPWLRAIRPLVRDGLRSRRRAKAFRAANPELPPFFGARRNFCNAPSGADRVCATASLPLADFRAIGRPTGATVNGVLHAVIAGALRAELTERGEPVDEPTAASFGIAADPSGSTRLSGNNITPTTIALHSNVADPVGRLLHTACSCLQGVELRRVTGVEMAGRWAEYGPRTASMFRRLLADRSPVVVNHVTTANVAGPTTTRWLGDVEVVDWFSFAVAVSPANVNITVYSYNGRMNIGLVASPEALSDPHRFLEHMASELAELLAAVRASQPADTRTLVAVG